MGTDRENIVLGNLMMMWKLKKKVSQKTEKKNYGHFLTALKSFKNPRELHHCLRDLKISNTEKT